MKLTSFLLPFSLIAAANIPILQTDVVTKVHDGDTVTTSSGVRIRLACIDSPEISNNKHGKKDAINGPISRDWLKTIVLNKQVNYQKITTDLYGRTVARIYLSDGTEVNYLSVKTGHSVPYMYKSCPWAIVK